MLVIHMSCPSCFLENEAGISVAWILWVRKHNKGTVRTDDNGHETMMQCGGLGKKVLMEIEAPVCQVRTTGCKHGRKEEAGNDTCTFG